VERDACMCQWDQVFPQYGLRNNKGYTTDRHWKALETHGPTSLHRFSFWPVRDHSPHVLWTGYPRQGELFPPEQPPPEWSNDQDASLLERAACSQ
jgi:ribonuclease HII